VSTQDQITISSLPSEKASMNYDLLRKEGLDYLQKVVGKIWTDYNTHDPGLTVLEELCYAITDLGYRTNLDIKDILAINENDDSIKDLNNFFTAREILTNAPYTQNDYRKLLIDVNGIKNAWFDPSKTAENDFYYDVNNKVLTHQLVEGAQQVYLNGLYEVLLEFDDSEKFGDLNDNTISLEYTLPTGDLKGLSLELTAEFPYWSDKLESSFSWDNLKDIKSKIRKLTIVIVERVLGFEVEILVNLKNEISVSVVDTTTSPYTNKPGIADALLKAIEGLIDPLNIGEYNVLQLQKEKVAETKVIVQRGLDRVHENRNLCEDFVKFNTLKIEEILLCAEIEIAAEKDTEAILAEIYFLIGQFLAPDIKFYSFAEMVNKGYQTVEIFQGPRLDHGFIDTAELELSSRRESIHVSDLINIIMDIDGVIAIRDIQIANFPLGDSSISAKSVKWCLQLAYDKNFVPRLSPEKSKVTFIKKGIPFTAKQNEVDDLLAAKKAALRIAIDVTHELDLEIPNGNYYDLENYSSIQLDFPINYGIGHIGLPSSVSDLRKAQAKQLKGFLLFFDQFLANYCAQLAHVKHLFSMNGDIDRTYFNQALYDIPNVNDLYAEFINFAELGTDPEKDDKSVKADKWKSFTEIVPATSANDHQKKLDELIEDEELFCERRNAFLDHLLARFSEKFADYVMLAYSLDGKKEQLEIIKDKLAFLNDYPQISYERGKAFNYKVDSWNTSNVSGLEKRVSRLLGIENYNRRDLASPPIITNFIKYKDAKNKWRFKFVDSADKILLKSQAYSSEAACDTGINSVIKNGIERKNYVELTTKSKLYYFNIKAKNGEIIATSNSYKLEIDREKIINHLIDLFSGQCNGEGFYLIEHILLRTRSNDDKFLPISVKDECACVGSEDPYSFRATCVMPYWTGRFPNMDFRLFVERTIREETPAHIFMKICWIDEVQMANFQKAYYEWLVELAKTPLDQDELTKKQNQLITILDALRNVYPVSYLYDCQETENTPVRLGQSILGTFIPTENE
jgi:uncharacterized protein YegP (UPF0339 family)